MHMPDYGVFFDNKDKTYRLPVNPEQIDISCNQKTDTYEILKLGQIVLPSYLELKEYSFECELPKQSYNYVETLKSFKDANFYLKLFEYWRKKLIPVRFIVSTDDEHDINTLVLIKELKITEKAGEEGDKYVSFSLIEYKPHAKREAKKENKNSKSNLSDQIKEDNSNPKNKGTYTIQKGDTLWGIAKKYYGNGAKYTKIYEANKDKIKNPSLIYSGQRLTIPS